MVKTMVYLLKNGGSFHGYVSHNQRVFQIYISEIPVVGWLFDIICPSVAVLSQKKNTWLGCRSRSLRDGPQSMTWIPCSALQPFPMMFGFPFPWCLAFIVLPIIKQFSISFPSFCTRPICFFPNDSTQAVQAQRIMSTLEDGQGAPPSCPDFFFVNFRDLSSRKASTYTYTYIYIHQFIWVYVGSHMGSYMGLDGFIYEFIGVYTWN